MGSPDTIETMHIDLGRFLSDEAAVFTGRDRGQSVRKEVDLDALDRRDDVHVVIDIPDEVFAIASSFWLGMFGPSVRTLGPDGFRDKYSFVGGQLDDVIEDGIREADKYQSPLPRTGKKGIR